MHWCQLQFCRWNWLMLIDSTPSWDVQGSCPALSKLDAENLQVWDSQMQELSPFGPICRFFSWIFDFRSRVCLLLSRMARCIRPDNTSKCSYTVIHTIYMENWIPPHNIILISRNAWVLVPPPSNIPGSQHWSLRFMLQIFCLIQRSKQIHSVARVTLPTTATLVTLVLILTATRPSTAIWKPWVYSPGWAAKRLPDGKKNWSPDSIYRVTSTSGGRR